MNGRRFTPAAFASTSSRGQQLVAGVRGFRQWETRITLPSAGRYTLMVRCTNTNGEAQPDTPNWNPAGFMRNVIEQTSVVVG